MNDYSDAIAAAWRVFPLHPIVDGLRCACGNAECEAVGKHPRTPVWQHTPVWDAQQIEYLTDPEGLFSGNQLADNYGIVVDTSRLIVVDVDGRNGGFESAEKLAGIREKCRYIVETGSGGEHWYFTVPANCPRLASHLRDYPGIDFKSNGFVVGEYSLHKSGRRYEAIKGCPSDTCEAPSELIELLTVKQCHSEPTEVEAGELPNILAHVKNESHNYDIWLHVGMAIHNATGGEPEGEQMWRDWTIGTGRDDVESISIKWHGFGKSTAPPVTVGTLIKMAKENGYVEPVTFADNTDWGDDKQNPTLLKPPGLVGKIAAWINSRCALPREKLAVAAALQIVSNAAGLNYLVAGRRTSLNLISIGIAASRSGKGAIKDCVDEVNMALGLLPAAHGKFKSSQEVVRNAMHHQIVTYLYDEFGKQLQKVGNASKAGTHYLEDLLAEMIAMYSAATGIHGISGDVKREMLAEAEKEVARQIKQAGLDEGENARKVAEADPDGALARAFRMMDQAECGLVNPFLNFFGLTEPSSFTAAVEADPWLVTGGFLGRALIFEEMENVPEEKKPEDISSKPLDVMTMAKLRCLLDCGHASFAKGQRIERRGEWRLINWEDDAWQLIQQIKLFWRNTALEEQDKGSGLEGQAVGATELVIKVAGILCVAEGMINREAVEWAHELVKSVTLDKMDRARSGQDLSSKAPEEKGNGLLLAIMRHVESLPEGKHTTAGRARQSAGRTKVTLKNAEDALAHLAKTGKIQARTGTKNGKTFTHYLAL